MWIDVHLTCLIRGIEKGELGIWPWKKVALGIRLALKKNS
jgi:hypothetical protein